MFIVIDRVISISCGKMSRLHNKSQNTAFSENKCLFDNSDFDASLSLPPGCVGGERGMGLKFGGKGNQLRLKISLGKMH